jgi:hypothetical protein
MALLGQILGDLAALFGILAGMRYGFHWLEKQLQNKIQDEVKKTIHAEIAPLEQQLKEHHERIDMVEMWIQGFQVGRVPAGTKLDEP